MLRMGALCAIRYEILHETVPADELQFSLSYAEERKKILEPPWGSREFLRPFWNTVLTSAGRSFQKKYWESESKRRPVPRSYERI